MRVLGSFAGENFASSECKCNKSAASTLCSPASTGCILIITHPQVMALQSEASLCRRSSCLLWLLQHLHAEVHATKFTSHACWDLYFQGECGGGVYHYYMTLYHILYISYISYIYIFISCIKICHIFISQIYIMLLRVNLSVAVVAMTTNKTHRLPNGTTTEVRRQKRHKS